MLSMKVRRYWLCKNLLLLCVKNKVLAGCYMLKKQRKIMLQLKVFCRTTYQFDGDVNLTSQGIIEWLEFKMPESTAIEILGELVSIENGATCWNDARIAELLVQYIEYLEDKDSLPSIYHEGNEHALFQNQRRTDIILQMSKEELQPFIDALTHDLHELWEKFDGETKYL